MNRSSRSRLFFGSALLGAAFLIAALAAQTAHAQPAANCPTLIHDALVHQTQTTEAGVAHRATQTDVENAEINLIETQFACETIPHGLFCREKDWHLTTIERIAERAVELGSGTQAALDAAQARLAEHRIGCPYPMVSALLNETN